MEDAHRDPDPYPSLYRCASLAFQSHSVLPMTFALLVLLSLLFFILVGRLLKA